MKIPKMSIQYSGNSIENHYEEDRLPLRHKKVRHHHYVCEVVVCTIERCVCVCVYHIWCVYACACMYVCVCMCIHPYTIMHVRVLLLHKFLGVNLTHSRRSLKQIWVWL